METTVNPLFALLVQFTWQGLPEIDLDKFLLQFTAHLLELKNDSDITSVPVFIALQEYWSEYLEDDEVEENMEEFSALVNFVRVNTLLSLGLQIARQQLVARPEIQSGTPVKSVRLSYTITWEDGRVADFLLLPTNIPTTGDDVALCSRLAHSCFLLLQEQLLESGVSYFPDGGQAFDQALFDRLVQVMTDYAEVQPESEREDLQLMIRRIQNMLSPQLPNVPRLSEDNMSANPAAHWLENGGGF